MPKVSVIVPVYKVEKYIEKCVRSLFGQTLDEIEYIFVNDCTPDASMEVLQNVLEEYPVRKSQVKILNHTVNTGQSGARRDGMRMATGDFIIHCDADDWVELDMYEKMYRKAVDANVDSVTCDIVKEFGNSSQYLKYNSAFPDHKLMIDCIAPIDVVHFSLCNRLVSKKIYEEYSIGTFSGINIWEDVGISTRIRYYSRNCVVLNEPLYHYNRLNENSSIRVSSQRGVSQMCACAKKIELFFNEEKSSFEYNQFVMFLKLVAKLPYLEYDQDMWCRTFPETRKYIYLLKAHSSKRKRILMYILAYGGKCSEVLSTIYTYIFKIYDLLRASYNRIC